MTDSAKVKGVVLRGALKDVKESFPGGIPAFLDRLPGEARGEFFAVKIVHGMWYPYAGFVALLKAFHFLVGRGRTGAVTDLGMRAAERDLGTLLKISSGVE
jgi:hypothetical protein